MFSGSYLGLAMQELVQRKRKRFMTAPKVSSSWKIEQYVIPPVIEQLRGLPNSYVVVRIVFSNAWLSGGELINLSWRPCGFRDLVLGW